VNPQKIVDTGIFLKRDSLKSGSIIASARRFKGEEK